MRAIGLLTLCLAAGGAAQAQAPPLDGERTAVAVALERRQLPPIEAMQSWFLVRGEPVGVLAVEKGPAEVVVIRDPKVQPELDLLSTALRPGHFEIWLSLPR